MDSVSSMRPKGVMGIVRVPVPGIGERITLQVKSTFFVLDP